MTSDGYFIEPTLVETADPQYRLMREEIFGPVVTAFVYPDGEWEETLRLVDSTSPYALTGAVFSRDRAAIDQAAAALRNAAGNFYVNDKPTGAVVGQQPFGGHADPERTTRRDRRSTCSDGSARGRSRKRSRLRADFKYGYMVEE